MRGIRAVGIILVCWGIICRFASVSMDAEGSQSSGELLTQLASPGDVSGKPSADLSAMLQDDRPLYRVAAIDELLRRREAGIAPQFKKLLEDQSSLVRFKAAAALLDLGDQGMFPVLRDLLTTGPSAAKIMIAEVLARHGDDSGLDYARAQLTNPRPTRRMEAIRALAASKNDDVAYSALEIGLKDSDESNRQSAMYLLGKRPGKRSVGLLGTMLADSDHTIRWLTVAALANNGSRDAIPLLLNALGDMDLGVCGMASSALNKITGEDKRAFVLKPERARQLEMEWRAWWEANKDKPLPAEKN